MVSVGVTPRPSTLVCRFSSRTSTSHSRIPKYFTSASLNISTVSNVDTEPCAVCGKETTKICSKCKAVSYCGTECQKSDWESHEPNCVFLLDCLPSCDVCTSRLVKENVTGLCFRCGFILRGPCLERETGKKDGLCPGCSRLTMKSTAPTEDNVLALRDLVEKETNLLDNRRVLWCFALGHILFADLVPKNIALAKHYFSLSGSLGHGEGYRKLGDIYMSEGEWHQAKEAFEKGAALQSVGAMHSLGTYYQDGSFGGSSDYRAAKKWFKEGARLGDKDCIHSLGSIYFFGQGTTVNHEKAVAYFRRSAAEGDADSQVALGTCYAGGNGVVQSLEQAQYWWGKAEAQGRKRGRQDIAEGICY